MNERMRKLREALKAQETENDSLRAAAQADDATTEQRDAWSAGLDSAESLIGQIEAEERATKVSERASNFAPHEPEMVEDRQEKKEKPARSLGEHFIRNTKGSLERLEQGQRFAITSSEFRAATPTTTGTLTVPDVGGVVQLPLERPTVADLLLSGNIAGNGYTYFVEGAVTGGFTAVAEGAAKPELSGGFTQVNETLAKIAGWTKETDELLQDFPGLASVVSGRLVTRLALAEEQQILSGSGSGANVKGLLNRTGVQTEAAANLEDNADAIFRAMTKVQTASFLPADFIVINPADYQSLRLVKDANGQYLGGGVFFGGYGNGGVVQQPPLWGMRTVVTSAIAAGTVLVGSGQAAQVFRKGGIRVDIANQNEDDFINNLMTVRAEERLLVACYVPSALCKVTLSATPAV